MLTGSRVLHGAVANAAFGIRLSHFLVFYGGVQKLISRDPQPQPLITAFHTQKTCQWSIPVLPRFHALTPYLGPWCAAHVQSLCVAFWF